MPERFRGTCGFPAVFARAMVLTAELRLWWQHAPAEIELLFDEWREGGGAFKFEERTDLYLLDNGQAQVGIKLRDQSGQAGGAEIKTLIARLPGPGPCEAELWVKASSATLSLDGQQPTACVCKKRRMMRFPIRGGRIEESPEAARDDLADACDVELTEVGRNGDPTHWWTLGFEASGTLGSVEQNLALTLDRVLPRIPRGVLTDGVCGSYPAWLSGFRTETS